MDKLTDLLTPNVRQRVYLGLAIAFVVITGCVTAYQVLELPMPAWLKVAVAEYALLSAGSLGVAATKVNKIDAPAQPPAVEDGPAPADGVTDEPEAEPQRAVVVDGVPVTFPDDETGEPLDVPDDGVEPAEDAPVG